MQTTINIPQFNNAWLFMMTLHIVSRDALHDLNYVLLLNFAEKAQNYKLSQRTRMQTTITIASHLYQHLLRFCLCEKNTVASFLVRC